MAPGWIARLFPLPYAGVVVLLAVLILLTPNLLFGGSPSAGSLATQARLIVDRTAGVNVTHFYVDGLSTVRYAEIRASLATNLTWPVAAVANLTWTNASFDQGVLGLFFSSDANPVAVNVTATYVDASGTSVEYWGLYAFYATGTTLETVSLNPALSNVGPTPIDSLPITILLAAGGRGASA
ncbi:MAG TPA: hypothetical protein VIZ68_03615 [Thermoplasmata archaeon]